MAMKLEEISRFIFYHELCLITFLNEKTEHSSILSEMAQKQNINMPLKVFFPQNSDF